MNNEVVIEAIRTAGYQVTKRLCIIRGENGWIAAFQAIEDGRNVFLLHFTNGKTDFFNAQIEVI